MNLSEDQILDRMFNSPEFRDAVTVFTNKRLKSRKRHRLVRSGKTTLSESKVKAALESEGWYVLKGGWPDFLAVKGDKIRLIEVKDGVQTLSPLQLKMKRLIEQYLKVYVEIVRTNSLQ